MAIPKICGTETEYGVITSNAELASVVIASMLVSQFGAAETRRVRWDVADESPLRDARGFESAANIQAAEEEGQLVNCVLTNGARYYVDHAHPEFSTPECTNPTDCLTWDRAGELILLASRDRVLDVMGPQTKIRIYKNNSDGKGNSYGTHENYLVDRAVGFSSLAASLIPFFVTRQVFCGAGKVNSEPPSEEFEGFQLSNRADFIEAEIGLETTMKRPLVNTRDEPHGDPERFRRLHVICGDANMCDVAAWLKIGTAALVLSAIEDGLIVPEDLVLENPVAAVKEVSRDCTLRSSIARDDGSRITAIDVQWEYLERVKRHQKTLDDPPPWAQLVVDRWEATLAALEDDPSKLVGQIDWVTKRSIIEGYMDRDALSFRAPKVQMIDVQYHEIDPLRGLLRKMETEGSSIERMVGESAIASAVTEPPLDTRAYFRGRCLSKFAASLVAASWDGLIFDVGGGTLKRIPMVDPTKGTAAGTGALLDSCDTADQLVAAIAK